MPLHLFNVRRDLIVNTVMIGILICLFNSLHPADGERADRRTLRETEQAQAATLKRLPLRLAGQGDATVVAYKEGKVCFVRYL